MDEIIQLLNEHSTLKDEIDNLVLRNQSLRDQIYNYLVNAGLEKYSDDNYSVTKTEDSNYIVVSKNSLLTALSQVQVTEQQKKDILRIAFQSVNKSGSIQIKRK